MGERPGAGSFDADWLALREPVDHRSRAATLLPFLQDSWRARGWSRILDLGSGTGSNLRYLAPRLEGPQEWTLLDRHPELLERAEVPVPGCRLSRLEGDLAAEGLAAVPSAHVVTCSALLDLASEDWLRRLVDACRRSGSPAYLALTYDGTIDWRPSRDDDASIRRAVNAHQRRDKGLGPALGPAAAPLAAKLFREAGYRTWLRPSPWELVPGPRSPDAELVDRLVDGWARAAREVWTGEGASGADSAERIRRLPGWARQRKEAFAAGELALTVGHLDLLALPPR